ncbi:MAG TPA: hypothetical protein VNH11_07765 [Pirellulales bacterium]|nr:hypothetical protein [Pirellulales bacterium]
MLEFVRGSPGEFRLDECQVPCLKSIVPWSKKQLGSPHRQLASWLAAVRQRLETATARRPEPPADWARPAEVDCNCRYCAQLNSFLADGANMVTRIAAREDLRRHVLDSIGRHQCDVKSTLERKGSPHALLLTKTTGSFERAVKRFEADRRLLRELPSA